MITYTWAVTQMSTTRVGDLPNYVVQAAWTKTGTNEDGITGVFTGVTPFTPDPEQADFIPYDQLTEAVVLGWIQSSIGGLMAESMDKAIANQIAEKIDPIVNPPLPWSTE
jgi:hypothetical protein